MNRVEELELTVQLLVDEINKHEQGESRLSNINDELDDLQGAQLRTEIAESILAGRPCSCAELPFPHKRTRACFRRY